MKTKKTSNTKSSKSSKFYLFLALAIIAVIISLATLGSYKGDFVVEEEIIDKIDFSSLNYRDFKPGIGYLGTFTIDPIQIKTIKIKNDFFLARSYELDNVLLCFYDEDAQHAYPAPDEITLDLESQSEASLREVSRGYVHPVKFLEIDPYSEAKINLILNPPPEGFGYAYVDGNYTDEFVYDSVLIYEGKKHRYCGNLILHYEKDNMDKIPIIH